MHLVQTKICCVIESSAKIGVVESAFWFKKVRLERKFAITDLSIWPLIICEFNENRHGECRTFVWAQLKLHLLLYPKRVRHFEPKEPLGNSWICIASWN